MYLEKVNQCKSSKVHQFIFCIHFLSLYNYSVWFIWFLHTDTQTYIYIYTHTYIYIHTYTHTHIYIYIYTHIYIYIYIYINTHAYMYKYIYIYTQVCLWCNGYCHRKWTWWHKFKSWTRLIAFHVALIPLGKVGIQLFSLQLWVNSRTDWVLQPWWGN